MNTKIKNGKEWSEEFQKEFEIGGYAKYPNEVMLKVIFGDYLVKRRRPNKSWKVMDVGCAFGNKLIPLKTGRLMQTFRRIESHQSLIS